MSYSIKVTNDGPYDTSSDSDKPILHFMNKKVFVNQVDPEDKTFSLMDDKGRFFVARVGDDMMNSGGIVLHETDPDNIFFLDMPVEIFLEVHNGVLSLSL